MTFAVGYVYCNNLERIAIVSMTRNEAMMIFMISRNSD